MTSPSTVRDLRRTIDKHLQEQGVYERIQAFVREHAQKNGEAKHPDEVVAALQERGLIDEVLASLERPRDVAKAHEALIPQSKLPAAVASPFRRYLHLRIAGGAAFPEADQEDLPPGACYILHVHFRHQRFRSRPVPCSADPEFDESFLLELQPGADSAPVSPAALLQWESPISIVVTRVVPKAPDAGAPCGQAAVLGRGISAGVYDVALLSTASLEWRPALTSPSSALRVELPAPGRDSRRVPPVGLLDVVLETLPAPIRGKDVLTADAVRRRLSAEAARDAEARRRFHAYAKGWWLQYTDAHSSFKLRLVKVFAECEDGANRPTPSLVAPLRAGRLLESGEQAAAFVALLPWRREEGVGGGEGGRDETWLAPHAFLAQGRGDVQCHAVLLASLLLGFGLDAYVCVGTLAGVDSAEGGLPRGPRDAMGQAVALEHVWVVTRARGRDGGWIATHWEPLTGARFQQGSPLPYDKVGCVIGQHGVWANKQRRDTAAHSLFDLEDGALWHGMDRAAVGALPRADPLPLSPPTLPVHATAEAVEVHVRSFVAQHRDASLGAGTVWDEALCYALGPGIAAFEQERVHGAANGSDLFRAGVRAAVPKGFAFKGFPIMFNHCDVGRITAALASSDEAADILATRGDGVAFALRVRPFAFPEDACALWVFLGVRVRAPQP